LCFDNQKKGRDIFGSRRGGDRICPNGPDEGGARLQSRLAKVRISKSDSLRPKGGIRADSRLVLSHGPTQSLARNQKKTIGG